MDHVGQNGSETMSRGAGMILIVVGIGAIVVGVLAYTGALSWFGRLPGDIRIEGENSRVFIPFTSMLIVSGILSIALSLLRRFF